MKKLVLILLSILVLGILGAKVDLNTATLDEIRELPISEVQARDIFEYRTFVKILHSIYDLREIPSIDQHTLNRLKPLVIVSYAHRKRRRGNETQRGSRAIGKA